MASSDPKMVALPAGVEDLLFGMDTIVQIRQGELVTVTKINSAHIPYDTTFSVKDAIDQLIANAGITLV